jgi:hypothetical protein
MSKIQPRTRTLSQATRRNPVLRLLWFFARVAAAIAVGSVLTVFYCAWHLAFFLLCMFRPVVNVLVVGGVIMLPLSLAAFVKPETANGMPFWAILLMAVGFISFAMGYSKFVDWSAPPGEADPFERYRRRDWR